MRRSVKSIAVPLKKSEASPESEASEIFFKKGLTNEK